ncbi:ankyrin repeat-containing protein [Trifolium pratense]|uniref:Ankyrin repeat-containing protein n=2 Tax=Trifolium pratense TaxID=57577 RepID=A0A2K3MNV9_TRIPR|nr:ankyrin repeat-containing protein [Trifolium pratense]
MNSTTNLDKLKAAGEAGNIDMLYAVIQVDSSILEIIDSNQFVETPLHISASRGHLRFAIEVMNLKPSFALKLNQQGFSPVHLAMQTDQKRMVSRLVDINKDLVRVKGREGITPLHFASQIGEIELLAKFLFACPDSIEDVTASGETALHIALKNNNYEALHLLVDFLTTNIKKGARELEYKILNYKDDADNTILHISALNNEAQALRLLLKTRINLNAKNLESKTALDIATTLENKSILISAGSKPGPQVMVAPTLAYKLRPKTTIVRKVLIYIRRIERDISEEQRNTWLIIATLVATATYQSALTPVGGVYQVSASDNNANITSSNSTISTPTILILTPGGRVGSLVVAGPVVWFILCYCFSLWRISPTHGIGNVLMFRRNTNNHQGWIDGTVAANENCN